MSTSRDVVVTDITGSVVLPTGAATAANQTTANSSLSSIDGKITACNTGAVVIASGTITSITNAVTVSASNLDIRDLSSISDSVSAVQSGTWNIGTVTTLTGITNPVAVTGTFYQATQPVSAASLPLPTGAATETTLNAVKTAVEVIDNAISGSEMQVDVIAALPAGTNTIGNVGHGKTIKNYSATITADTDIVAAVASKRIKVFAYSITTVSTSENTIIFKSNGTAGTELWRVDLQAPTNVVAGANLATSVPGFLFATTAGEKLTADVSAAVAIHLSIAYFDDDAS